MLNDRQLRAFIAVGETGSMSKAAGQMYISVPALKKQMDALEKELGATLLYRTNQGVNLTIAGEEFLTYAARSVQELDEEIEKIREIQGGETATIRVGYDNSYVLDAVFYYAIPAFRTEIEDVIISINKVDAFDGNKTDLFFGANYVNAGDVTMHYLCDLPFTCVIPKRHQMAGRTSAKIEDLLVENVLMPPREMLAIGAPDLLNATGNHMEYIQLSEISGQYNKRGILDGQIGIAIGFEEHVNENLIQIPLEGYKFRYRIYSVGAEKKPCLRQFIDFLKDYYPKKCAEMCAQLGLNT